MTNPSISMTTPDALQPYMQPYVRLTQRNMQLFTSFSASPEIVSLWLQNGQKMFSRAVQETASGKTSHEPLKMVEEVQGSFLDVGQSRAFASLLQGLMQSHLEFLTDLAQTNMSAMSQVPAKMMENMQQAATKTLSAPPVHEETSRRSSRRKEH